MNRAREALARFPVLARCAGCGRCLEACPSYGISAMEADGPRGRLFLGLVLARGQIQPRDVCASFSTCLHCGKCVVACPMELPLDAFFFSVARTLRGYIATGRRIELLQRLLLLYPGVVNFLQPPLALAAGLWSRSANYQPFAGALPRLPFVQRGKSGGSAPGRKRVLLFMGCLTRNLWPALAEACVALVERAGFVALSPPALGCCGRPQLVRGADFRSGVIRNLAVLSSLDFQYLLAPCPACLATIRHIWPEGLSGEKRDQARKLADRAAGFMSFLREYKVDMGQPGDSTSVFWHPPCLMEATERDIAIGMLASAGFTVGTGEPADCCGAPFACVRTPRKARRTVGASEKELDRKLAGRIRSRAMANCAAQIVTACPGCLLALRREMAVANEDMPVRHIIELLAESLAGDRRN